MSKMQAGKYSGVYTGDQLNRVAFPLGGMGAGMICLEGTGAFSHVTLRHKPDMFNEPLMFAAVCMKGKKLQQVDAVLKGSGNNAVSNTARVLEGPVPSWKLFGMPGAGGGATGKSYGLPRFSQASFETRFPFVHIDLADPKLPLAVRITGWSPFEPGDADNASLPVAGLEYRFTNTGQTTAEAVFSFNSRNFMPVAGAAGSGGSVRPAPGGFVLHCDAPADRPWEAGDFCIRTTDPNVKVNHCWFRGGWFDALTMAWKDVQAGACYDRPPVSGADGAAGGHSPEPASRGHSPEPASRGHSPEPASRGLPASGEPAPGASLFVPLTLEPGESRTIVVQMSWYVGESGIRFGETVDAKTKDESYSGLPSYRPWYAARFAGIEIVTDYWHDKYNDLRAASRRFSDCLYATSLPPEILEAVVTNLTILKSPTVMRQADGRLWGWEGCRDKEGCCYGSCTHVWNYAQSIPHLFPALERSLRETEFKVDQDERGHQAFRTPLPIRPPVHDFHSAADGQLGGILKVYREWRIGGDTEWLRGLWPSVKRSLDYCIDTWDPAHKGVLEEPHHNTYDIEFWGPDGMCTSFYLAALRAAIEMGKALDPTSEPGSVNPVSSLSEPGSVNPVNLYDDLLRKGKLAAERDLFNGEYFMQKIQWEGLRAGDPTDVKSLGGAYSPEAVELLQREGPKYQYGNGCLSDGVLGEWMAAVCGLAPVLDPEKLRSHLRSVFRYNLRHDLTEHVNPQRPGYACGEEGGLLLCTWPHGDELSLPFVYSNEVWTGIEYQAAAHMIMLGLVDEGLEVVRTCLARYDGRVRNPFNQYECGHWYARSMSSYSLLQATSGIRYDAVTNTLHIAPKIKGDFQCFFATARAYGLAGVKNGQPFYSPTSGHLPSPTINYIPA
jgi:uncharacterized protein (DUF608 family)